MRESGAHKTAFLEILSWCAGCWYIFIYGLSLIVEDLHSSDEKAEIFTLHIIHVLPEVMKRKTVNSYCFIITVAVFTLIRLDELCQLKFSSSDSSSDKFSSMKTGNRQIIRLNT